MDSQHYDRVENIRSQIQAYYERKVPFRVYHGSTNSTRVLTFKRNEMVDISGLNRVLSIDSDTQTAIVEPNVPMDELVNATLRYGLMPPVVTEFPGITVGGAIQGTAAESASFRWGCFSQTVTWMEMILADGSRIEATPKENADLFYGTAGSCGSLGLITAAKVKLIPAKKYVTITNIPVRSFREAVEVSEKYIHSSYDFIECGMFAKDQGSVIIGLLSDTVTGKLRHFRRAHDPWYYLYVEKTAAKHIETTDTLPLKDYLFRYDRGAFWGGKMAFEHFGVPFTALNRFILDPIMRTRKLYQALQESAAGQVYICQDIVLPTKSVVPFMEYIDTEFSMYPVGFCPIKPESRSPLQCNGINAEMVWNVGVYGLRVTPFKKFVTVNKQIEAKTQELGGKKWFYAHSYYSEKEFWHIYDKRWYDALRKKYHASSIPDIYTRTRVKEQHNLSDRRAVYRTIFGRAKLRIID
jgi:delta24-sterol reductase